ncbi:hypothetical protein [Flavobacterium johnsoniae]|uniref:Uncharacterized protein n=1 Tax=Flavobacterium johnsoniae TaxID=986 RepID=A0A1J7CIE6_FLAJO|nr:hypothetical protein [Flavobacterium johnsoniae]OIV41348.1 hypothetical protein BKM63_12450 [Flavobacterium johnsoniae]
MQNGVINLNSYVSKSSFERIKSNFFLYDTLYTYNFDDFKNLQLNSGYGKESYYNSMQLLIEQGYLKLFNISEIDEELVSQESKLNLIEISNVLDDEYEKLANLKNQISSSESANKFLRSQFQFNALEERLFALLCKEKTGKMASPVTSLDSYNNLELFFPKANVYRVLIQNFPIPDRNIPLLDIIQYKNEESNKLHFLRLRTWIDNIAKRELTEIEIAQEIETLIAEYKYEMKLAGMKYKNAKIEFLYKFAPQFLEKIVKFSISELFDPFFKLRNEKISLLQTENNAKGNELAYLIKSQM